MDWLQTITPDWLNVYDVAWRRVVAIIVIGLAYVIGKSLSHVAQTMGERLSRSAAIGNLWSMMIKVIVVVLAIVLVLEYMGRWCGYSVLAARCGRYYHWFFVAGSCSQLCVGHGACDSAGVSGRAFD